MKQAIWGISDLHLSFAQPESRDRYTARWKDHAERIEQEWRRIVAPEDLVLLPGDISMAKNHRDLQQDLRWIEYLPGIKVFSPGNHDRWFNNVAKIKPMLRPSQRAVDASAEDLGEVVVCGAKSAEVVGPDSPDAAKREADKALARLKQAIEAATLIRADRPLIVLWHHPPFDRTGRPGPWVELFESAKVDACVYGHLHDQAQWRTARQGIVGSVRYHCVAADAVGFRPLPIRLS